MATRKKAQVAKDTVELGYALVNFDESMVEYYDNEDQLNERLSEFDPEYTDPDSLRVLQVVAGKEFEVAPGGFRFEEI